jgi:hypothetical protein
MCGCRYYELPDEPLHYRNKPPLDVACCYSFNAYWTANAAIHPYWFKEFGLDRWCRQVKDTSQYHLLHFGRRQTGPAAAAAAAGT